MLHMQAWHDAHIQRNFLFIHLFIFYLFIYLFFRLNIFRWTHTHTQMKSTQIFFVYFFNHLFIQSCTTRIVTK